MIEQGFTLTAAKRYGMTVDYREGATNDAQRRDVASAKGRDVETDRWLIQLAAVYESIKSIDASICPNGPIIGSIAFRHLEVHLVRVAAIRICSRR